MSLSVLSRGGGSNSPIYLEEATDITAKYGNNRVGLSWNDPNDIGTAVWTGTKVIRKVGSAPTSENDGTTVGDYTVRDAYVSARLIDTGVTNGITYYYGIFPHTSNTTTYSNTEIIGPITPAAVYTGSPSSLVAESGDSKAIITWTDPAASIAETTTTLTATWDHTIVCYQTGSYPTSPTSGTIAVTETTRNQYSSIGAEVPNLINGETYYLAAFAIMTDGSYGVAATTTVIPRAPRVMTVIIDTTNSNPKTCCTYADDAIGMTAGSSNWDDFFGHYPVLLSATGEEVTKLNPNNFAKDVDGNAVTIDSSSANDVMIAFPRRGISITKSNGKIYVKMTDAQSDANFKYYAHTRGASVKNVFYYGAFLARKSNNVLRSVSGVAPTTYITLTDARTYAQARGTGFQLAGFYQRLFIQVMGILKYKNLNGQVALGRGYVEGNTNKINTGGTIAKGMDFGETTGKQQMKVFGIEDFWGNVNQWMDGCYYDSSKHFTTDATNNNFNDSGSGYTNRGTAVGNGYIKTVLGTTSGGFVPTNPNGSETTYFSDRGYVAASNCIYVGGYWRDLGHAGPFCTNYASASYSYGDLGARTCYIPS